jgi:hypothetical protein
MMDVLFAGLPLAAIKADVMRNIVSLQVSQDLFDDLSDRPQDWAIAQAVEIQAKPSPFQSRAPAIDRPFEEAIWNSAIDWPFSHWQASRFSDGSFGVWYGSDAIETTVYETVYHWVFGFLRDAGWDTIAAQAERKVYAVACHGALLDFRTAADAYPALLHPSEYALTRTIGARMHREGHPGLITRSARYTRGENLAIFNPVVLSNPRPVCTLRYRLEGKSVAVEKTPGKIWRRIALSAAGLHHSPVFSH